MDLFVRTKNEIKISNIFITFQDDAVTEFLYIIDIKTNCVNGDSLFQKLQFQTTILACKRIMSKLGYLPNFYQTI